MSISNFEILSKLGDGAFSSVFKVVRKSDQQIYALKKVKLAALKQKEKENSLNEVRILASVTHPNIIAYKEAFIDESTNTLCIVMELAEHGDLLKKITQNKTARKNFPESEIWDALIQITRGLKALHEADILHRDLKGANIFISKDGVMKLGDLNVSKVNKKGLAYTQTGTPYYASPEVWQDKPYDWRSDIWSLGCVIYEMTALNPPFTASDMRGLYNRVVSGVYPSIPNIYSSDLANTIKSLLQVRPAMRPSCKDILSMQVVLRNSKDRGQDFSNQSIDLLGTIKFDGIKNIKKNLPAANYNDPLILELPKIEEVIKNKIEVRSYSNSHLRKGHEIINPSNSYLGIENSPKGSLANSRSNSREHVPIVKDNLPQYPRKSDPNPLIPGYKKGKIYKEEIKYQVPNYGSPLYNKGPLSKPPSNYQVNKAEIYNNYPEVRAQVQPGNYYERPQLYSPNSRQAQLVNKSDRSQVYSSNSRQGSREGLRPDSGLNRVGNIVLQSPKYLIPKGLPRSQRQL